MLRPWSWPGLTPRSMVDDLTQHPLALNPPPSIFSVPVNSDCSLYSGGVKCPELYLSEQPPVCPLVQTRHLDIIIYTTFHLIWEKLPSTNGPASLISLWPTCLSESGYIRSLSSLYINWRVSQMVSCLSFTSFNSSPVWPAIFIPARLTKLPCSLKVLWIKSKAHSWKCRQVSWPHPADWSAVPLQGTSLCLLGDRQCPEQAILSSPLGLGSWRSFCFQCTSQLYSPVLSQQHSSQDPGEEKWHFTLCAII